jgi:MFS family permease
VSAAFIAGFVLAQVGAFVSFLPLLQIILPLKVSLLAPERKAEMLGLVASLGALAAAAANLAAGWISDRTRSPLGRRRPWLLIGAAGTAASYALIGWATTPGALIAAMLAFQVAFNVLFAPLLALIPDRVPVAQRGWVAALAGLGFPLGSMVGSAVVGAWLVTEPARLAALAAIVLVTIAPFALLIREPPAATGVRRVSAPSPPPLPGDQAVARDFGRVWLGRFLVVMALSLVQTYLLFYVRDGLGHGRTDADAAREVAELAIISGVVNVAAGLAAGHLSDRLGRRKAFVAAGATIMAGGLIGLALAHDWAVVTVLYAVYGCGAGCYYAADLALVTQVLPSAHRSGRDLGLVNLSNTIPQVLAPWTAGLLLQTLQADIRWVLVLAAAVSLTGALAIIPVRTVR